MSTLDDANAYMATKMFAKAWIAADDTAKNLALANALSLVNGFNYLGTKTVADQANEWPRTGVYLGCKLLDSTVVPADILKAQYEIALALLQGIDPEKEIAGLRIISRGIASVRTSYNPNKIPEHLENGIPSFLAWSFLSPYFNRSSQELRLSRVS